MINRLDLVFMIITAISLTYATHIWWMRKHDSLIRSPLVAIVQIMGILIVSTAATEVLYAYYYGTALYYNEFIFEVGVFGVMCAPVIFLLFLKPLYEEMRENSRRTSGIIENAANAIITVDKSQRILSSNKAAQKMFGYSAEGLRGQNVKMLIHDADGQDVLEKFFVTGETGPDGICMEVTGEPEKGAAIPLELYVSEHMSQSGRLYTLILRSLSGVKKSDAFYKDLFQNSLIGQYIVADGKFIFVNPQFQKYTGYSERELLERERCIDLVHEDDREEVRGNAIKMLKGEKISPYEYRVIGRDGAVKWILETVAPVEFNGKRAVLGNFMNINQYKEMETAFNQTNKSLSQRVQELERRNEHIEILNEMSEVVQSCLDVDEACRTIIFYAQKLFPADSGAICLIDDSQSQLTLAATWGSEGLTKDCFTMDQCWGLRRGVSHVVRHNEEGLRCAHLEPSHPYDYICIPLISQTNVIGVFFLSAFSDTVNYLSDKVLRNKARLAKSVAEYASLALRNIKLQDKLRQRSIRDPLTGLYNRGYMEESLGRELARAARQKDSVGVIMLDVDHFKRFNDTYGHEAGDVVLTSIARLLQQNVRAGDIACRYGGEEFVVIMPGISVEDAAARAERLRFEAKRIQIRHAGSLLGGVTLSLGVSLYPGTCERSEDLVRTADEALYKAKQTGRDRTVLSEKCGDGQDESWEDVEYKPTNVYYF